MKKLALKAISLPKVHKEKPRFTLPQGIKIPDREKLVRMAFLWPSLLGVGIFSSAADAGCAILFADR